MTAFPKDKEPELTLEEIISSNRTILISNINEVETREVNQEEIEAILSKIQSLDEELEVDDGVEKQFDNDIAEFETQVTELVAETRANKADESEIKLKSCDETIQ